MTSKVIRRTLELLMDKAETQYDWDIVKYTLDDYLDEGYKIQDMVGKYNTAYKNWVDNRLSLLSN